ncbi:MAG: UDP-3-O-(3-hydroxymyristoyl)glucosamine N-acyltransferase [Acidobacteria bacterium]|nr:UDP-3-O-(3-hydroxymyristoyl)glucosamine N-acyltransferase [Acidobacteriota bacterium]
MKTAQIAGLLGARLEGDADREIVGGAALGAADETHLAFFDGRGEPTTALASKAGCLLLPPDIPAPDGAAVIRVTKPRHAFARALRALHPPEPGPPGVHPSATVAATARLGAGVSIGPQCVIEDDVAIGAGTTLVAGVWVGRGARIGEACKLFHGVSLYPGVRIGDRAIVHAGARLGSDGFGFVFENGRHEKFPQIGGLRIGDDAEIGANATVDRGALGDTVIGNGVKLDNLVHVGHNCRLGDHVVIAAQTGFSGGVVVEDYVVMGGQVGVGEGARIGKAAQVGGQAGPLPNHTLEGGKAYWGTPARPYREHMKKLALVERLPKLAAEVEKMRARLKELEDK